MILKHFVSCRDPGTPPGWRIAVCVRGDPNRRIHRGVNFAGPGVSCARMESVSLPPRVRPAKLLIPALVGAAVAVGLGVYGNEHDPTGESIFSLVFTKTINMKAWFATGAVTLGGVPGPHGAADVRQASRAEARCRGGCRSCTA